MKRGPLYAGLLQGALLATTACPGAAQLPFAIELRGGAVYSTAFARGTAVVPAELEAVARDLEVGPRVAPVAELALAARPRPSLVIEFRSGASIAGVTGRGGGSSWRAGRMTAIHILFGVRAPLSGLAGLDVRAGAGKVFYRSADVNLLEEAGQTGVLFSAGFGHRLPGPLPSIGVAEVQWHEFAPASLADAGAGAGGVTRLLVHVSVPVAGTP